MLNDAARTAADAARTYPVVDAHVHVGVEWFEPVEVLLHHMDTVGVGRAILTLPVFAHDDGYQRACVSRFPDRFANVVAIPPDAEAAARLRSAVVSGVSGVSGLRIRVSDRHEDPYSLWKTAREHNLAISCLAGTSDLSDDNFVEMVRSFPEVRVVIEHLGGANRPEPHGESDRSAVFSLAEYGNVFLKIHGLAEFAQARSDPFQTTPFITPLPALLDRALEKFGPERLMWGSDFPNVCSREGYGNSLCYVEDYLGQLSERERASIFGYTATMVFQLDA